jgi:hypothetical protein
MGKRVTLSRMTIIAAVGFLMRCTPCFILRSK